MSPPPINPPDTRTKILSFFTFNQIHQLFYKAVVTCILCSPFVLINLPFHIVWIIFGWFLYASKLIFVGKVERLWLYVWTGEEYENLPFFSKQYYNNHDFFKLTLANCPNILIQTLNSYFLDRHSTLYQVSITFSCLSTISGIYRLMHSQFFRTGSYLDAPITVSLFGIEFFILEEIDHEQLKGIYSTKFRPATQDKDEGDWERESENDAKAPVPAASHEVKESSEVKWTESPMSTKG